MNTGSEKMNRTHIAGWREFVSFPEWDVEHIEAKLDTGARTSAIHVEDVKKISSNRVRFHLVTSRKKPFKHVAVTADLVRLSRIRSSTGHAQERYVVATTVKLGLIKRRIELSLVGRDKMLCRMLIGRTALDGILVNSTEKYLLGDHRKLKKTRKLLVKKKKKKVARKPK